jgi:hypothetical protein
MGREDPSRRRARTTTTGQAGGRSSARRKANSHRKPRSKNGDPYLSRRRKARDRDDANLLEALRSSPGATIDEWAATIGKSKTSAVAGLHRLRAAGLAESVGGRWALVKQEEPREPAPKWIEPLSAARKHRAHV